MVEKQRDNKIELNVDEKALDDVEKVKEKELTQALTGDSKNNYDALNPLHAGGQMAGSHETNINEQTNLNLGAVMDPGGIDPASDRAFMKEMKRKINKRV